MSLSNTLKESIANIISSSVEVFVDQIVEKHDLNRDELLSLWSNNTGTPKTVKKVNTVTDINTEDVSPERLMSCTVPELKALCRARGLVLKGKKADLISRLSGVDTDSLPAKAPAKSKKTKKNKSVATSKVISALTDNIPEITIRRNKFGNLEHPETGLVFDKETKSVIGKQNDNDTIDDLTEDDIELCKKFKFKFKMPENLDKNVDFSNVDVKELNESDDESEIEVESESDIELELDDEVSAEEESEYEEVTDED